MRIEPWVELGPRWPQKAWRFARKRTRHSLGRPRGRSCLRVIGLLVFSAAFLAPILSGLNLVAAQTGAIGGSAELVSPPGANPNPQGVIRIRVNLVQVDAVVTDSKGHQVTNLGPEDFEILEDGRPQTITNFSYISTGKPAGIEARAATPPAATGMTGVAPVRLQPEQVRRSIVILVDDLHIAFENMVYVRKALNKLIDDDIQPGDLVAIFHTSGGLGVRQQFTNDKGVLHAAVDRLHYYLLGEWGRSGELTPWPLRPEAAGEFAGRDELKTLKKYFESAERSESDFRQVPTTVGTLVVLEYVLGGLRDLPGRKAVFLVSEGFPFCADLICRPRGEIEQETAKRLREVADLANRSAAVVYTVSASGLPTFTLGASVGSPPATGSLIYPQMVWWAQDENRWLYFDAQWPMASLAKQTEGLFVHDDNDIAAGMHEMMDDLSGYYLIGYKPSADTFKEDKVGRGFHPIQVKVKVRGLHVRSRPGFFGIPDRDARPVNRTREEQLKAALISPFGTSGVRVELTPQFLNRGSKESVARLWLRIDARDLTFQDAPDGSKRSAADLVVVAYGDNGAVVSGFNGRLKGSFHPAELEALRQRGVNYRFDLPIKEPGGYQVRAAVLDPASQKVGSANQFIEIPNLRPDRLALSGIALGAQALGRSGPAGRRLQTGDRVSYDLEIYRLALSGIVPSAKALGESGPAVRRFQAGDRVSYELEIYNPRRGSAAQAPNLESRIQIFREGRLVSAQNPGVIRQVPSDSNRLVMSGELSLAPDMAPGDYALLVTVIDTLSPPRHSATRQWIDFEVVP